MFLLDAARMEAVLPLFSQYTHQIPVIYSVLEGTAPGQVYVDRAEDPASAVLVTPVGFLFVAGEPLDAARLGALLFEQILPSLEEKGIEFFTPDDAWHAVGGEVFTPRRGFVMTRRIFALPQDRVRERPGIQAALPEEGVLRIEYGRYEPTDRIATWRTQWVLDGHPVSACAAFLVGGGQAELSVCTEEAHRGKGYATVVARALVEVLQNERIIPCWNAWSFREASHQVARKVGFCHAADLPAWHWDETLK